MHTRIKRKRGLTSHLKHNKNSNSMIKINRPKTFKTEEGARSWAEKNKLKHEQYTIEKAKRNKKFMVVKNPSVKKLQKVV